MNVTSTHSYEPEPKERERSSSSSLLFLGDCVVVAICMAIAFYLRYVLNLGLVSDDHRPPLISYLPHYSAGFGLFFLLAQNFSLYDSNVTPLIEIATTRLVKIALFWAVMFLGSSLILKLNPAISRLFVGYSCALMCILLPLWRFGYLGVARRVGFDKDLTRRVLIVGCTSGKRSIMKRFAANSRDPYVIVGGVSSGGNSRKFNNDIPILGSLDDLESIFSNYDIDVVVLADSEMSQVDVLKISKICERRFIEFDLVPGQFEVFRLCLGLKTIGTQPVLGIAELPQNRIFNRLMKRIVDIVGSMVGLVLAVFPILVLIILIKLEDPGPALFFQRRTGKNGKSFKMIKLRSMRMGSEKSDNLAQSTSRNDDRVLKCGKFMRRWNIDELPQFFNVLMSDMSLVGPRPERVFHVSKLLDRIPYYQSRHSVRPGMTGWAQVNGLRGNTDLEERIRYDLQYIENWSLWLDTVIQLRTLFQYKNAY